MSILSRIKRPGPSGFGYASTAEDVTRGLDLNGKTILLTGCNSGLGLETLRVLSLRGARVLAAARSRNKARHASATTGAGATPLACDLAEPDSVRACVAEVEKMGVELAAIICNAGIMALPELTLAHGYEAQFFTHHIGHFLLVTGLLSKLAPAGRVVMLSSESQPRRACKQPQCQWQVVLEVATRESAWVVGQAMDPFQARALQQFWSARRFSCEEVEAAADADEPAKRCCRPQTLNHVFLFG
jgi:hypothetical protein